MSEEGQGQDTFVEVPKEEPKPAVEIEKLSKLERQVEQLTEALLKREQSSDRAAPRQEPRQYWKPTKDELNQAYTQDQLYEVLDRWTDSKNARLKDELVENHIRPIEETGLRAISTIAAEQSKARLKHYNRFSKEIDQMWGQLPDNVKANPESYKFAHDVVVGQHFDVLSEEIGKAQTKPKQGGNLPGQFTGRSGSGTPEGVPSVEEALGEDAARSLEQKGLTPDGFARSLGYKGGWKQYFEERVKKG